MFSTVIPIILADIFDLLGGLVGLVLLVGWVVRQIVEANKPAAPAKGQPRPAEAPAPPPAAVPAAQQADPLRSQVEEFLRRSGHVPPGGQPAAGERRAQAGRAREIEVLIEESDVSPDERRPLAEPFRGMSQPHTPKSPQSPGAPRKQRPRRQSAPRRETVAEHVAENMAAQSQEFAAQTSRLGQRIIEDDRQFDVQLKAKFDHSVGTLTGSDVASAEQVAIAELEASRPAAQIAALLSNPVGVRQAIVLNEVLRRPSERW